MVGILGGTWLDFEGTQFYNYQGSAVKGSNIKVIYNFPYGNGTVSAVRVSQDFSCKYPNSPQINCELPTNNINPSFSTIFAQSDGSVEFPPNSAQTNISSPSATIDDSNYLPSFEYSNLH